MSKKHFIALADMLRTARMKADGFHGNQPYNPFGPAHLEFLADWCETQNPRFKRERWLAYIAGECGPNGGKARKVA